MPEDTKPQLILPVTGWILVLGSIMTISAAFSVAQFQLLNHENRLTRMEGQQQEVREMLMRIDERTRSIKLSIDHGTP